MESDNKDKFRKTLDVATNNLKGCFTNVQKVVIGLVAVFLVIFCGCIGSYYATSHTVVFRVQKTERIQEEKDLNFASKYIVLGEKLNPTTLERELDRNNLPIPQVYENTDSWLIFKFNSRDVQAQLATAEKRDDLAVEAQVIGWRIPFFSWQPNIIAVKRIIEIPKK